MKKVFSILLGILLLIGLGAGVYISYGTQQAQFDFSSGKVYLPNYVSIWCDRLPTTLDGTISVNDKGSSTCGYANTDTDDASSLDAYTPNGCFYYPQDFMHYKVVNANEECSFSFLKPGARVNSGSAIKINNLQKICFNEDAWGYSSIKYYAEMYGLRINSANGKTIFTKNCDLKSNINDISNIDYIPGFSDTPRIIEPSTKVNHYINGYSEVVNDKDVVTFNGDRIYIYAVGSYYPIEKSADGYDFANSLKPRTNNKLICVPSQNPLCEGGTTIKVEDKSCSGFDRPEDYIAIGNNEECTFKCINNKLVKDSCRDIVSCPPEKPYRNPVTNVCEVAGTEISEEELQCSWYQDSYSKDAKVWRWYNFATVGLIKPDTESISGCKTSGWVYLSIIGLLMAIIISAIKFIPASSVAAKK